MWLGLAVIMGVGGCEERETSSKPEVQGTDVVGLPKTHQVGETASTADYKLTLKAVKLCTVDAPFKPATGVKKLGVQLLVEGTSKLDVPVNPFYAVLSNSNGDRFEATLLGCKPQLQAGRVTRGHSASGWVTFDIPDSENRGLELMYKPVVIGASRTEVTFSLDVAR